MNTEHNIDTDPLSSLELLKLQVIERYRTDSDVAQLVTEMEAAADERDRLRTAIWPGLPPFVPTAEKPQQNFYEAVAEGFRTEQLAAQAGPPWSQVAASAYAAYGHSTGNKNFRGDPMPRWDQLSLAIRTAWEAAVRHASDFCHNPASNPETWAGWISPNYRPQPRDPMDAGPVTGGNDGGL